MKIRIIVGGPAGLYFAILMQRDDPAHDIVIHERGRRNATWGFGVVFSDRALDFLRADDEAMVRLLLPHIQTWPDLTIVHNDTRIPISGNGFAAIDRLQLLSLRYAHAEALGVRIEFEAIESLTDPALGRRPDRHANAFWCARTSALRQTCTGAPTSSSGTAPRASSTASA
jgi:hypothetical protein